MSVGSHHVASFKLFSNIASVVVFLTGVVVLAGWLFNVTVLKSFHAGLIAMKPNTAVCFILLGVSLWLLNRSGRLRPRCPPRPRAAVKPFTNEQLLAAVRQAISKA